MIKNIALSLDSRLKNNNDFLNLNNNYSDYPWLHVFTDGYEFRDYVNNNGTNTEAWILSSDNVESINLAATVKKDNPQCVVCLVSPKMSGSITSRAKAANIDSVIDLRSLKERISGIEASCQANKNSDKIAINYVPKNGNKNSGKQAFVLTVMSASGGSGKSCVSTMISVLCQAAGFNTLLLDADFQFGDCSSMLGINNAISIDSFINDTSQINKLKCVSNLPAVLSAPSKPELSDIMTEKLPEILEILKSHFDVIIVNTENYWSEKQALLLENDTRSLFLIDQRPSSINSSKKALDLCSRCGIATGSVSFALNKCSKHALFTSIDVSCALKGASVFEIMDGGLDVDECLTCGKPLDLIHSRNNFAVSLWSLIEEILPSCMLDEHRKSLTDKDGRPSSKSKQSKLFKRWRD